jgi:hypothetical protein
VYDNVRAKWPGVLRRPTRLPGLFSGYHAPSGLVAAVLRVVGVRLEDLTAEVAAAGVSRMMLLLLLLLVGWLLLGGGFGLGCGWFAVALWAVD